MARKINCPNCKKLIDSVSASCPHCGITITDEMRKKNKISISRGITFILALIIGVYFAFSENDDKNKKTEQASQTTQKLSLEDTALPGKALEFSLIDYKVIERAATGRHRLEITIIPNSGQEFATQKDLISTVMHTALEAYKKTSAPVTVVNMLAQNTGNVYADRQLAFIVYIPDQKGFDGKQSTGIWVDARACERGFTTDELTYLQLWGKLRTKYLNPKTDGVDPNQEDALKAEIEQTMGKKLDIDPMLNVMWKVEIEK